MKHLRAISLRMICAAFCATACVSPDNAQADGLEIAFFNIDHDTETGALEVVHRFFMQDIEIALTETTGQSIDMTDLTAVDAVVKPYMEARFSLATVDGVNLKTEWGGVENRANTLLIRQSATLPGSADGLVVHSTALHETHPKHVNILHATLNGQIYKRDFLANGPPQKLFSE